MDQDTQTRISHMPRKGDDAAKVSRNLAILYEGFFTVIVRMQAKRQQASAPESFRGRMKGVLADIEREAVTVGYSAEEIRDTRFAVVAFLDEVVLHSNDPVRSEWEKQTLAQDMFGQADAGIIFFDKLEYFRSRPDSQVLADVLEVYLLCLLLGFEGRYSGGLRGELDSIVERVRRRIEDIRGDQYKICATEDYIAPPTTTKPLVRRLSDTLRLAALAAILVTILLFIILKVDLVFFSNGSF